MLKLYSCGDYYAHQFIQKIHRYHVYDGIYKEFQNFLLSHVFSFLCPSKPRKQLETTQCPGSVFVYFSQPAFSVEIKSAISFASRACIFPFQESPVVASGPVTPQGVTFTPQDASPLCDGVYNPPVGPPLPLPGAPPWPRAAITPRGRGRSFGVEPAVKYGGRVTTWTIPGRPFTITI